MDRKERLALIDELRALTLITEHHEGLPDEQFYARVPLNIVNRIMKELAP